jgi:hypothetical protein
MSDGQELMPTLENWFGYLVQAWDGEYSRCRNDQPMRLHCAGHSK